MLFTRSWSGLLPGRARLWLPLLLLTLSLVSPALALDAAFTVSLNRPWTHLIEVEMRLNGIPAGKPLDLAMPVWTPGSYMIREYARHLQEFEVTDESGKALPWQKIRKDIWRVENGGASRIVARYKVYANELTVRTNEFNDRHAFWNNAALLLYPVGALNTPSRVAVRLPAGWTVATGMEPVAGQANTFQAPDYDTLYDCPFLAGKLETLTFTALNKPHRIVIDGSGNYDPEQLSAGVQKIVEEAGRLMGGELPYDHYTFLVMLTAGGGGGLEHKNSTALLYSADGFDSNRLLNFLSLAAHEYFHLWNVKRIKPDALGPFDYGNENYTRLLWVAEGITSYYEPLILRRAGLINEPQFRSLLAGPIRSVESTPGRQLMSLEEGSFDAWIKEYRPNENSVNTQISYYTKGQVVGMLLDLTIRERSGGKRSLDDVLRALWTEFGRPGKNYTPADFQRLSEQAAGGSLAPFFEKYVRGRAELEYDAPFAAVGLRLLRTAPDAEPEAYFGARVSSDSAGLQVTAVPSDTPAFAQGIAVDDILLAVDEQRLTDPGDLNSYLAGKAPGDTVRLTLFRGNTLRTIPLKLGGRLRPLFALTPLESPTPEQRRRYREWATGEVSE